MKRIIFAGALASIVLSLTSCAMPWSSNEPEYIWGEKVSSIVQDQLASEDSYHSSRKDNAPLATRYAVTFLDALVNEDTDVFLSMQGLQDDILNGVDYDTWLETADYSYLTSLSIKDAKIESNYEDDLASVNFTWGSRENTQSFSVDVEMSKDGFQILPQFNGMQKNFKLEVPGTIVSINGQDFSQNVASITSEYSTAEFDVFPVCDIIVKYTTKFGEFEKIISSSSKDKDLTQEITDKDQLSQFVSIANERINQLWSALWKDRSKEAILQIVESESLADKLIKQRDSVKDKTITYVEVMSSSDIYPDRKDLVLTGDIVRINLKYFTKFDISNGALPASMSSCKDFTWIELRQLEDGSWKIHDMGVEGKQSILTYLNYTNNEW